MIACLVLGQDYQSRIYSAYIQNDMNSWKTVMDEIEANYETSLGTALLYELVEAEYGYVGYCISVKRKKEARILLEKAEDHLQLLLKDYKDDPRVLSLQGAFYGLRISLTPLKAPVYGKKSMEANHRALQLGPSEPQAWMEKANIEFYKPAVFGGSKKEAVPLYKKAVRLYESDPQRTSQNWLYMNCLAGLGIAYEETGQIQDAGEVYRKLLILEPSFSWIRDDLYPQFLQKHSAN